MCCCMVLVTCAYLVMSPQKEKMALGGMDHGILALEAIE